MRLDAVRSAGESLHRDANGRRPGEGCGYARFMTPHRTRLMFGVVGVLLIAGGVVVAVLSEVWADWFSGLMIAVGALTLLVGLFPRLLGRDR